MLVSFAFLGSPERRRPHAVCVIFAAMGRQYARGSLTCGSRDHPFYDTGDLAPESRCSVAVALIALYNLLPEAISVMLGACFNPRDHGFQLGEGVGHGVFPYHSFNRKCKITYPITTMIASLNITNVTTQPTAAFSLRVAIIRLPTLLTIRPWFPLRLIQSMQRTHRLQPLFPLFV
jgi:hypothetical protein